MRHPCVDGQLPAAFVFNGDRRVALRAANR
jgi:hypothetical protein